MRVDVFVIAGLCSTALLSCSHLDGLDDPPELGPDFDGTTGLVDAGPRPADAGLPLDGALPAFDAGDAGDAGGGDAYVPPPPPPPPPPPIRDAGPPDAGRDSGPPDSGTRRFQVRGDTVYDSVEGLWWQLVLPASYPGCTGTYGGASACNFTQAMNYCSNLVLGGYSDWSVPTLRELRTIVSLTASAAKIDPSFSTLLSIPPRQHFWTRTYPTGMSTTHYSVDFDTGSSTSTWADTYMLRVRCVRPSE
jgi:hypothetical protein